VLVKQARFWETHNKWRISLVKLVGVYECPRWKCGSVFPLKLQFLFEHAGSESVFALPLPKTRRNPSWVDVV